MKVFRTSTCCLAILTAIAFFAIATSTGDRALAAGACTWIWQPVCGIAKTGYKRTWSNICWAKMDGAKHIRPGACW